MTAVALVRIETKRSAVPWVLPLLAALFLFDPFRTASGYPAVWTVRASVVPNKMLTDFVPFAAAFAAWAGSREGRRRTADLLASTARSAWPRQATAFTATAALFVLPFLAGVTVLYIQTARVVTWGGPPLWPVAVSVVTLIAVCAVGFAVGVLFPGRFTAPLVMVGVFIVELAAFRESVSQSGPLALALLSPSTVVPPNDSGVFHLAAPDLTIVQVMFLAGIAIAALGVLALFPARGIAPSGIGRRAHTTAIAVVAAAVALAGTAIGLAGTAQQGVSGWDVPALHDAASDRPLSYQPDCAAGTGFQVCVHPAFSGYLDDTATALAPVAAEIAGLPGAPVRGEEVSGAALASTGGLGVVTENPPVYQFNMNNALGLSGFQETNFRETFQQDLLGGFVAPAAAKTANGDGPSYTLAQQAVVIALMRAVGSRPTSNSAFAFTSPADSQIAAAAARFAALSPAARHAWLATHLAALQSGKITLEQLP